MIRIIIAFLLLSICARGQTVRIVTQNYNDLPGPSISVMPGPMRLTLYSTDGADPLNITQGFIRAELAVIDASGYTQQVANAVTTNDPGQLRWLFSAPPVGTNRLYAWATFVESPALPILDCALIVTSAPSAGISATFSNTVDLGNLTVQWEIQGDGDLAPYGTDRTISPASDLGAALGRTNERYTEAHVRDGFFETIHAGTVEVSTAIGFLDTTKVRLAGETNSVVLTNTSVQARTPTNDNEVATKAYADTLAGGPNWPINWTTNADGRVGFTNAYGGFWSVDGAVLHTGQIQRRYNGGDTFSNYYATSTGGASDGFNVFSSNGAAYLQVPVEFGGYMRMLDAQTIPNPNAGWRASVRITQLPTILGSGNGSVRVGLLTNQKNGDPGNAGMYGVGAYGNGDIQIVGVTWNNARTNNVTGGYYPSPGVLSFSGVDSLPIYLMADKIAGTTTGSAYVGVSKPGSPVVSYQRAGAVSYVVAPTNIGVGYLQFTANAVTHSNAFISWDDFVVEEGLSW